MANGSLYVVQNQLSMIRTGDLLIAAVNRKPITASVWDEYLNTLATLARNEGAATGGLQYTPDHGPNAAQRKALSLREDELGMDKLRRMAIVSDSVVVRGAVTAISWMIKSSAQTKISSFKPTDYSEAFRWLHEQVAFDENEAHTAFQLALRAVGLEPEIATKRSLVGS